MANERKPIPIPSTVVEQLRRDLDSNGVRVHSVAEIPSFLIDRQLLHPEVLKKSQGAVVALSGCATEGRDYMFLAPIRRDEAKGTTVTDLDPIVMVFNSSTKSAEPSGVALFHSDFEGRTEPLLPESGYLASTVCELRSGISGSTIPFDQAPRRFTNAMHFAAEAYNKMFGSAPAGEPSTQPEQ